MSRKQKVEMLHIKPGTASRSHLAKLSSVNVNR